MAPKKTVKRISRMAMPKPKQERGFDPRLVALGAIGGGVAGRRIGGSRAASQAATDVRRAVRSTPTVSGQVDNAIDTYRNEYAQMPRVKNGNKITTYNQILKETGNAKLAREQSGMSKADVQIYKDKKYAKSELNEFTTKRSNAREWAGNPPELSDVMGRATKLRQKRTVPSAKRRGGVKGAIGGAALAALVQLVAKELNKK